MKYFLIKRDWIRLIKSQSLTELIFNRPENSHGKVHGNTKEILGGINQKFNFVIMSSVSNVGVKMH